jgi:hypothetical protein
MISMGVGIPNVQQGDGKVFLINVASVNAELSFSRGSIGTYQSGVGTLASAATNIARYEYDSAGAYKGLLLEASATNLITNSEGNLITYPVNGGVSNAATSLNAFFENSIQFPAATGTSNYAYKQFAQTSGTTYCLSAFVVMNDLSAPVTSPVITAGDMCLVIQGNVFTASSPNVINLGGGLYRIWASIVASATSTANYGVASFSGQSKKAFRVTGYQLEVGTAPSSYKATSAASFTQSADILQKTPLGNVNPNQGTFVIEHDAPSGAPLIYSGSNAILTSTGAGKVCIAYNASGTAISKNGAAVVTSGVALVFATTLNIGYSPTAAMNAHIKSLTYYPSRFSNVDVVRLST